MQRLLTLVESPLAFPTTNPPTRRADTPIKLAFKVASIEDSRSVVADLGGQVGSADTEWNFRGATHCDCLDPEGNVIQLIEP
jgi:predicted enzyme related to lactoylglutathione lyase